MTTQRLSSEKLIDFSLFKNLMRRRGSHVLVAFLTNFFTMCVPILMIFNSFAEDYPAVNDLFISRAVSRVNEVMAINLFFIFAFAIYLGVITLGYMMKRRSAHFYHALPQKRETLYMTSIASALFCAAIGAVITAVIAVVELFVLGVAIKEVLASFALLLFKNFIFFITTYAITVFVGTFSGSGIVQVLMTLVVTLYPLLAYCGAILLRTVFATYFDDGYYFESKVVQWLSPYGYAIINYLEPLKILPTVIALAVAVALILGGNAIYRRRAIENSEKTIVFKKLGTVIKYMLMAIITAFSGLFFYAIGYGVGFMIFGFVSGATLSFMLFNTILEKSPKAMFNGIKGLAIFMVAFALYALVFCFDVFRIDEYVPNENSVSYAEISISGVEYDDKRFDDPEMIHALVTLLKNQRDNDKADVAVPRLGSGTSFNVYVTMYNKLGMPFARRYNVSKYTDGAEEFLKLYANDPRMNEAFEERMEYLAKMRDEGYNAAYTIHIGTYRNADASLDGFVELYKSEFGVPNYERFSKPLVGYVATYDFYSELTSFPGTGSSSSKYSIFTELPVYEDMTKTAEFLMALPAYDEYGYAETRADEEESLYEVGFLYDTRNLLAGVEAESEYDYGYGMNLSQYPSVKLSKEDTERLYTIADKYYYGYSDFSIFTAIDTDVIFRVFSTEDEDSVIYLEDYYAGKTNASKTYIFPAGKVPEDIKALLK